MRKFCFGMRGDYFNLRVISEGSDYCDPSDGLQSLREADPYGWAFSSFRCHHHRAIKIHCLQKKMSCGELCSGQQLHAHTDLSELIRWEHIKPNATNANIGIYALEQMLEAGGCVWSGIGMKKSLSVTNCGVDAVRSSAAVGGRLPFRSCWGGHENAFLRRAAINGLLDETIFGAESVFDKALTSAFSWNGTM
jgi:hypothetical protein